jgi:hypothetical protein
LNGLKTGILAECLAMQNPVDPSPEATPTATHGSRDSSSVPPEASLPAGAPRASVAALQPDSRPAEFGGPTGPEPTRYGDWEKKGRCIDF